MSYLVNRYNTSVHVREDGAQGWLFGTDDFRPFAKSQIKELAEGGIVLSDATKEATEAAYNIYLVETINEYKTAQAARSPEQIEEEKFEMRAAFGRGERSSIFSLAKLQGLKMKHNKDYRPVKNNEKKVIGYIQKVWARDGYMWRTFDIDKNVYYGLGSSPAKKKDAVEFVLNRKE